MYSRGKVPHTPRDKVVLPLSEKTGSRTLESILEVRSPVTASWKPLLKYQKR